MAVSTSMATYTLNGLYVRYDDTNGGATDIFQAANIDFAVEPGVTSFSYVYDGTNDEGDPTIDINGLFTTIWPWITGGADFVDFSNVMTTVVSVSWTYDGASGTSVVLAIDDRRPDMGEYYFVLGGDPLPPQITSPSEWDAFNASLESTGLIDHTASSPFAVGDVISFAGLLNVSVDPEGRYVGTNGDDDIAGQDDDDGLHSNLGADTLRGNGGDDWLVLIGPEDGALVQGGDGFDDMVISEGGVLWNTTPGAAEAIVVNFADGPGGDELVVTGRANHQVGATRYWSATGEEIERVVLDFGGDLLVLGDDTNNRIRFESMPDAFELQGGDGTDQLDLHRTLIDDDDDPNTDPIRGVSSSFFLAAVDLSGTADNMVINSAEDGMLIGTAYNWEQVRFTDGIFTGAALLAADQGGGATTPTENDDTLIGSSADDMISGLGGNDSIAGLAGRDTLDGGVGNDTLDGGIGDDYLFGGPGDDLILPGGVIPNDHTDKHILPGSGNDTVDFGTTADGDLHFKLFHYDLGGPITATLNETANSGSVDKGTEGVTTLLNVATGVASNGIDLYGTDFDDTFNVTLSNSRSRATVSGGKGDDTVTIGGATGQVNLDYNNGDETAGLIADFTTGIVSNDGYGDQDSVSASIGLRLEATQNDDSVMGTDENDRFLLHAGNNTVDGGDGFDVLRYDRSQYSEVVADMAAGTVSFRYDGTLYADTVSNIEEIIGSRFDDQLSAGVTTTGYGLEGNDGNDTLIGGAGDDTLIGEEDNDSITGGDGFDEARIEDDFANATITDLGNAVRIQSADGDDTIANDVEQIRFEDQELTYAQVLAGGSGATSGDDTLTGTENDDTLDGLDGDDSITGLGGRDKLIGGNGNDTLIGGDGNDELIGHDGNDLLDASGGAAGHGVWGDWVMPGLGQDTVIGHADLFLLDGDGIDLSYHDLSGVGGLTVTVGANGTGTVVSGTPGLVNDSFTYAHRFEGSQDGDLMNGSGNNNWEGWGGRAGSDTMHGAGGYDELLYHQDHYDGGNGAVAVNFATGTATDPYGDTDTFSGMEAVRGTPNGDVFIGSATQEYTSYRGLDGADTITGTSSWDQVDYGSDDNYGGAGGITADLDAGTIVDGFGDTDSVSQIDQIRGTSQADSMSATNTTHQVRFEGQDGDDTLQGGLGNDRLEGDDGDDILRPGATADFGYDDLLAGLGNDTIDFADYAGAQAFGFIGHWDLNDPVTVTVDAGAGTANVVKSGGGTTTILNVLNAIEGNGLGIGGTWGGNDVFNVTFGATDPAQFQFLQLQGESGNDTYNFGAGYGEEEGLRISYHSLDAAITANMVTGIIDKGVNGQDTINNSNLDRGIQLRGTTYADSMTGSERDESFITRGGDDTVHAGGGRDEIDFGRNAVTSGINANLGTGQITGDWDGDAFTVTVSGIERVQGSLNGNDTLIGDGNDNELVGHGGDDSLSGGGGIDAAVFDLDRADVTVTDLGTALELSSNEGTDTVSNDIEFLEFNDQTVAYADMLGGGSSTITGTENDDTLTGTSADETIQGLGGNDLIDNVGGGSDLFDGGAGIDTLISDVTGLAAGVIGFDALAGTHGRVGSTAGQDTVTGIENFTLIGGWDAILTGNGANNRLVSDTGADNLTGLGGNDTLLAGAGMDTLAGGDGFDLLEGGTGNDLLYGGTGYDTLRGGDGNDSVHGGDGRDLAYLGTGNDIFFDNGQGGANGQDTVWARGGNDTVQGGNGNDLFYGEDGNDSIYGRLGADKIYGGAGYDTMDSGDGNDSVWGGNGRDLAFLGNGNDIFFDNGQGGVNGQDTVWTGNGNDTVEGGNGKDVFYGEDGYDRILGRLGDDKLYGGAGYDTLDGGDGNDSVWGGDGRDLAFLGAGNDIYFDNAQGGVNGQDTVWTQAGDDTVEGGNGNDIFYGQDGADSILGRLGDDTVYGGNQNDTVDGGAGSNRVFGGNGDDLIRSTGGNDTLSGNAGADTFLFTDAAASSTLTDIDLTSGDSIELGHALWTGNFDQVTLDAMSDTSSGALVVTLDTGAELTFDNLTSNAGLLDIMYLTA